MLDNGNYFYVYAPTYFSTLEIENTSRTQNYLVSGIGHLINSRNFKFEIFEKELKLIEADYKNSLKEMTIYKGKKFQKVESDMRKNYRGRWENN